MQIFLTTWKKANKIYFSDKLCQFLPFLGKHFGCVMLFCWWIGRALFWTTFFKIKEVTISNLQDFNFFFQGSLWYMYQQASIEFLTWYGHVFFFLGESAKCGHLLRSQTRWKDTYRKMIAFFMFLVTTQRQGNGWNELVVN